MTNLVALPDLAVITAWKKKKKKEETLVTHVWEEKEISAHVAKKKKKMFETHWQRIKNICIDLVL